MSAPNWSQVVADLMVAVESTQHAYKSTRVLKRKLSTDESRRVMAFHQEIDKYLRDGRRAVAQAATDDNTLEWRKIVLNLLRAHSLVWERLRIEHDHGIPDRLASGQAIEGRDPQADRFILQAVATLAASDARFDYVTWDGREVLRL